MKKDIFSHIKGICDFMNVEVPNFQNVKRNQGYSLWQLKFSVFLNRLIKTSYNPAGLIPLKYCYGRTLPHRIIFGSRHFPKILRGKKATIDDFQM